MLADLRARQITVSTELDAPRDGRSRGRVSWLLRQLGEAPDDLKLEAHTPRATPLAALMPVVRESPEVLYPDPSKEIRKFGLSVTRNMGLKKSSGQGSFIESVLTSTRDFYAGVLQDLRPWKAQPPKIRKPSEADADESIPDALEESLETAKQEAAKQAAQD